MAAVAGLAGLIPAGRSSAQTSAPAETSAFSGMADMQFKGRRVIEVEIRGNVEVKVNVIANQIRTRAGEPFDPATVAEDYQRIYNLRKFSNVEAKVEPTANGVIVAFVVTEQRQIKAIKYRGASKVDEKTLTSVVEIKAGEAIDPFRIARARAALEALYRDKNFPLAHVTVDEQALSRSGELIFDLVEGPQTRIRRIGFKGALSFTEDKLRDQIKSAYYIFIFRAGKYDPEQVDEDVAALRKFYESKGFFDVRVGRRLVWSPDLSELEIDFLIEEGPRYIVDKVIFQHNAGVSEQELRPRLKLLEGKVYDDETLQRDTKEIVKAYSDHHYGFIYQANGNDPDYLHIDSKNIFRKQAGRVILVYDIHEGRPFRLGNIYVKGNSRSQDKLVFREFHDFGPGDVFNASEMDNATERLRKLPYFQNVSLTPIGDDPNVRDILVEVQEQHTASFNVGAGINSNGGLGGNLTYEQRNFDVTNFPASWRDVFSDRAFIGAGEDFRASLEPGTQQTDASVRLSEPYLFDKPIGASDEIYLREVQREHYYDRRIGDTFTLSDRLTYELTGAISPRWEQVKIRGVDDPEIIRAPEIVANAGDHDLTSCAFSLRYDTTNPGLFPYRGAVTQVRYEPYGVFGGNYSFQKLSASYDAYQTVHEDLLDRKTVLCFRGNAGWITGDSVFFERFYGGGIGSLRGFKYRQVSPRSGIDEDPVGGNFVATGTLELNFPVIGEGLRAVVFSDFGDVEPNVEFRTVRSSVGAGVRVILPFLGQAPIAVDFAVPITKDHTDQTQLISFSLGLIQ
jgi:outer membrane protein assembly factor BamA